MRPGRRHALLVCGLVLGICTPASAIDYAPLDKPGPALKPSPAALAASLDCTDDVSHATRAPVLLTPATTVTSAENFAWNYERAFIARGIPYCTSNVPGPGAQNMLDTQARAEYVVYAIRRMYKLAGRKIAIQGHSQGGMIMRWALRFWPDTRAMVDDVIGMAGTNHGSSVINGLCAVPCAESLWQQGDHSNWTKALNSRQETFAGISYTEIYSHTDEFVAPNYDDHGTSSVHGPGRIANIALQEVCPGDLSEHLLIGTTDPTAYALAMDALDHDGPASPARINRDVCATAFQPGVDPITGPLSVAAAAGRVVRELAAGPKVAKEPPLRCYVTASCPATPPACKARTVKVRVRSRLRGMKVTANGKRVRLRKGVAKVKLPAGNRQTIRLKATGRDRRGKKVTRRRTLRVCS